MNPPAVETTPLPSTPASRAEAYLAAARRAAETGPEWPAVTGLPVDNRLGVVGAGTMGSGIALCALAAGLTVTLLDANEAALQRGVQRIRDSLYGAVARGRLPAAECQQRLARLHPATDWAALSDADAVIEAVFEDSAVKQAVMARLHAACAPRTLFISNTSTLDIDELAQGCGRPDHVLGMHFLTPAHVTPLVEVVRGRATSDTSLARARALAVRLGKLPVLAGNAWGFIGNRLFEGYLREVDALQLEGVPAARIDAALEAFGFALGPCRTLDMAGTDLVSQVLTARATRFEQPPAYRRITRRLAELGRFGHKSGRGHYLYEGRVAQPDPDLARVCAEEARALGIAPQPDVSDDTIVRRCVTPLADEGQRLLAEGMACRASDIDLVWVLGYGFPAHRGGPMVM
ncbi:3-hydroxyacyl-CoA dehydrogenase [Hydrogenophaga sp.]|nr:3-hydroxyacyl-CoA dehydrogenase [Hydrogenophaga sp.]MDP3885850.1 3-hydroxyacyl-CoA dehydrogenase NAD-binding domain-containing protein [Hydrogenophaga sp.]MDZ4360515.1 3-hydroxyacyl-CoA dehydrogenase NAD-binding domain-containing protein [Variovorax sp.]